MYCDDRCSRENVLELFPRFIPAMLIEFKSNSRRIWIRVSAVRFRWKMRLCLATSERNVTIAPYANRRSPKVTYPSFENERIHTRGKSRVLQWAVKEWGEDFKEPTPRCLLQASSSKSLPIFADHLSTTFWGWEVGKNRKPIPPEEVRDCNLSILMDWSSDK